VSPERLDLPRIGIATAVAAGLGVGLAVAFLRYAQSTPDVGPTSATLEDAYSSLYGAAIGLALGGALGALSVRRGSRVLSGLLVGLLAYVVVLAPVFVSTDDVSLDEDLSLSGLVFLAFLAVPLAASALVGAIAGDAVAQILGRRRRETAEF
jgi:hypothetical protein